MLHFVEFSWKNKSNEVDTPSINILVAQLPASKPPSPPKTGAAPS